MLKVPLKAIARGFKEKDSSIQNKRIRKNSSMVLIKKGILQSLSLHAVKEHPLPY
jgi:hypothetical protein